MRDIARAAGVGPATLYRRYPTKQDLATAAFAEQERRRAGGCAGTSSWRTW
ncbi:MAG TPA: helix-turn-helix domain-containing protein [Kribbella sp.]